MRKVRDHRGVTCQALALLTGIPRVTLSKIETGRRGVRLGEAVVISRELQVSLEAMCSPEPLRLVLETQIG